MTTWPHPSDFTSSLPPLRCRPAARTRPPPSAPLVNYETANFTWNCTQITIITSSAHHVPSPHCKMVTRGHHLSTSKWVSFTSKLKMRHSRTSWHMSMGQPQTQCEPLWLSHADLSQCKYSIFMNIQIRILLRCHCKLFFFSKMSWWVILHFLLMSIFMIRV